jgi:hypothetical protein
MSYPEQPKITSGPVEIVATGTLLSHKNDPVTIYVNGLGISIVFILKHTPGAHTLKMNTDPEKKTIIFEMANVNKVGQLVGPPEPVSLGETTDLNGKVREVTISFRVTELAQQMGFLLYYSVYLESPNV